MRLVHATRSHWDRMHRLQGEFERAFAAGPAPGITSWERGLAPRVKVTREDTGYLVQFEVPGVDPKDLNVEAEGRTVKVEGHWSVDGDEAGTEFSRTLQFPEDADLTSIEATSKHGILTVRVPRKAEATPRQIEVNVS